MGEQLINIKVSPEVANMLVTALHGESQRVGISDNGKTQRLILEALQAVSLAASETTSNVEPE